jgi:nucleotide-binding universal stress UspA family protein
MKAVKNILVPVDFSPHSAAAVDFAVDLAGRYDAAIELLFVYEPIHYSLPEGYALMSPVELDRLLARFQKELDAERQRAVTAGAKEVSTKLSEGLVRYEIQRIATEGKHDMIVMGTHGRKGLKHLFLGSVAEAVIRSAPCPVLTTHASE